MRHHSAQRLDDSFGEAPMKSAAQRRVFSFVFCLYAIFVFFFFLFVFFFLSLLDKMTWLFFLPDEGKASEDI